MSKVTVYIPTHNYGKYIKKAVDSVISQTLPDWELIIINDGSTDDTEQILKQYENHPKIRIIDQVKKGLNISNNVAIRLANAPYMMRLDADDYLDENALLVLSHILDTKPDVGLVYPDYYCVDESGDILELVRRKKIGEEVKLLDLPAHGACTMIRKECLIQLEGYSEEFSCQDGYDLWLRFLLSFKPYNINIPLFYYRQHDSSLTRNQNKILATKEKIEKKFIENFQKKSLPTIVGIAPILKEPPHVPGSAFSLLSGKTLLWHSLKEMVQSPLDRVVVTSDDDEVLRYCKEFERVETVKRLDSLSKRSTPLQDIVEQVLTELKMTPEAVMVLPINTPFRKKSHIERAIYTLSIFDVDTVISVTEELAHCYFHEEYGLTPIQNNRSLRIEKKAIYKETGAILLSRLDRKLDSFFMGRKVGHIVTLPEESIKIKSSFDVWLAQKLMDKIND